MDLGDYVRFVFALAFVLGLIGLATVALKRFGMLPRVTRRKKGSGKPGKRLGIVEIAPIDAKRRLILVRRDDVEHLIVLGIGSELLIESGIAARSEVAPGNGASPKTHDTLAAAEAPPGRAIPETSGREAHP